MGNSHQFLEYRAVMYVSDRGNRKHYVGRDERAKLQWDIKQGFMIVTMQIIGKVPRVVSTHDVTVSQEANEITVFTNNGYVDICDAGKAITSGCELSDNLCLQIGMIDIGSFVWVRRSGAQLAGPSHNNTDILASTDIGYMTYSPLRVLLSQYLSKRHEQHSARVWVLDPNVNYSDINFDGAVVQR